jgi:hypothetical protein
MKICAVRNVNFNCKLAMTKSQMFMFILQKLISDERFQSLVEGDVHRQLPVQFVNAVVSTPSMSDEIQVEIMKVCG